MFTDTLPRKSQTGTFGLFLSEIMRGVDCSICNFATTVNPRHNDHVGLANLIVMAGESLWREMPR